MRMISFGFGVEIVFAPRVECFAAAVEVAAVAVVVVGVVATVAAAVAVGRWMRRHALELVRLLAAA